MALRILLVGDDDDLVEHLDAADHSIERAVDASTAELAAVDCVVVSDRLDDVVDAIDAIREQSPVTPIVVASRGAGAGFVTAVFRAGAVDHVDLDGTESLQARVTTAADRATQPPSESPAAKREAALSQLYEAAQQLLLATTPEEIASITVETASDALGLPITGVYRADGDALVPLAVSSRVEALFGEVILKPGASLAWESFEDGDTRVIEDVQNHEQAHNPDTPIRTELHVPFGEEYVLVTGTTERREFDEYQIDFAELLATTAEAAMGRAQRSVELKQYETIFRTIDERVCVVGLDGTIRKANAALGAFVGVDAEQLVGRSVLDFVDPDDADAAEAAARALGEGSSTTIEATVTAAAGETHPCEIDITTLPSDATMDGVVAVIHDISDRKRVESALEQERDRFAELFEHVPDPLVEIEIVDGEPYIRSTNAAFETTFDAADAVGEPLNEYVLPPDGDRQATTLDQQLAAGEPVEAELKRETGDGIRYFLFRGVPVDVLGTDKQLAFGIYTDITDQRLRERRLGVLNRVFRHNIRNDMNVVIGRAEYLEDADDPDQIPTHAEIIRRNAEGTVDLADGIHAAERALALDDAPARPFDDVVRDAVAPYRDRDDVSLTVHTPTESLPEIDERLRVPVQELLENAIKHTGGATPAITVTVDQTDQGVSVAVSDTGPGIPEVERAAIEEGTETPLDHGSGVGLWLVRWITTALGGEVALDVEDGTTVTLTFPRTALDPV